MSSRVSSTSVIETITDLSVQSGGFSGKTDLESLANIEALHQSHIGAFNKAAKLLANSKIPDNAVPGISKLIAPTIKGPATISMGTTATYKITNFNSFGSYSIQASIGSVSRLGDTITYIAPNVAGDGGFEINGRAIKLSIVSNSTFTPIVITNLSSLTRIDQRDPLTINVSEGIPNIADTFLGIEVFIAKSVDPNTPVQINFHSKTENNFTINGTNFSLKENITTLLNETDYIVKVRSKYQLSSYSPFSIVKLIKTKLNTVISTPIIESPTNNTINFTTSKDAVYTGSSFSNLVNTSQFISSDWQIATDSGFQNIYFNLSDNPQVDQLTGKPILLGPSLSFNTSYYIRTRYRDNEGNYSQWSPIVKITTSPIPVVTTPVLTGDTISSNSNTANPYLLTANSSVFSISDSDGGTHGYTEWKTSNDPTFTVSTTTGWQTANRKLDLSVHRNERIYVMVRYQSSKGINSEWSNVAILSNNYTP